MRSSTGEHYVALDHVRALAAFMVVVWHFTHGENGYPVPHAQPVAFPASVLDEGHTGVALFMTLSGYLFAKLLDGRRIRYRAFLFNRALRLLPLLSLVILLVTAREHRNPELLPYLRSVANGWLLPTLPNGGWSITVEFHYYLVLPLFLWMLRRSRWLPLSLVAAAIVLRVLLYHALGEVQHLSYGTLVGRVDQFALGMVVFQFRSVFARRHLLAGAVTVAYMLFYGWFAHRGGFYHTPSDPLWIVLPTIEGAAYAALIAWYDTSFTPSRTGVSGWIAQAGAYSYSIYLLHFFAVFHASRVVHRHIMDISSFYLATLWALLFYLLMIPIGHLSFRFVEAPFLARRRKYTEAQR